MSLTPPEWWTQKRDNWRVVRQIKADGACAHCQFSQSAWGQYICKSDTPRQFPRCTKDGLSPRFALDEHTIRRPKC